MSAPLVSVQEAARRLKDGSALLLDVREPHELRVASVAGALHVPMRQVPGQLGQLPRDKPVFVMCHHGGRSQQVADWLQAQGFEDVHNVAGGIDAWACDVDPSLSRY